MDGQSNASHRSAEYMSAHLVVERIDDIMSVKQENEHHRCRYVAAQSAPLLAGHRDINEDPEDESRPELVERFDVKRADRRIELATHPKLGCSVKTARKVSKQVRS